MASDLGPGPIGEYTISQVKNILTRLGKSHKQVYHLQNWLQMLPTLHAYRFKSNILFLDYLLNDPPLENITEVRYPSVDKSAVSLIKIKEPLLGEPERLDVSLNETSGKVFTEKLRDSIKYGMVEELKELLAGLGSTNMGMAHFSTDAVRAFKSTFIYSTTLAALLAEEGGVSNDLTAVLIEKYLTIIQTLTSYDEIAKLWETMLLDFTNRTYQCRIIDSDSILVAKVCKYVQAHLNEKIGLPDLAAFLALSPEHLSREFRRNSGHTITAYIQMWKIEESKRLLKTSKYSIAQIAQQLNFSSQHYFQTIFKKHVKMTPLEYRNTK